MRIAALLTLALPLAIAGCGEGKRSMRAELDIDQAHGTALLSCKESSSGTCYAIFTADGQSVTGQAAVGSAAEISGIAETADYCAGPSMPQLSKCNPRPASDGKQIVRIIASEK